MLLAGMMLVQDAARLEAMGRYSDAESERRSHFEQVRRSGRSPTLLADAAEKLADNLAMQLRLNDAEPLYRRALELRLQRLGERHRDTARSLRQLASLSMARGTFAEAEGLARRALDIQRTLSATPDIELAWALNTLAEVLAAKGNAFDADPLFAEAVQIARTGSEIDLAILLNNHGNNYYRMATATVIPPMFRRRAGATRSVVAPSDDMTGGLDPLRKRAFLARGRDLLNEAIRRFTATSGADHPDIANLLNGLAANYRAAGMIADAEAHYSRALAIKTRFLPPDNRDRIVGEWSLGSLLASRTGREAEARSRLRAAIDGALASQSRYRDFDNVASAELRSYAPVFATSIRVAWQLANPSAAPAR